MDQWRLWTKSSGQHHPAGDRGIVLLDVRKILNRIEAYDPCGGSDDDRFGNSWWALPSTLRGPRLFPFLEFHPFSGFSAIDNRPAGSFLPGLFPNPSGLRGFCEDRVSLELQTRFWDRLRSSVRLQLRGLNTLHTGGHTVPGIQ